MAKRDAAYRGCLLGVAVGDAMGCAVDRKSWDEIARDYGPNGLMGYDLVNGYADVSSYTQLTAYCANGLLAGLTRGQMRGRMAPFVRYAEVAIREWGQVQHTRRTPDQRFCWISQVPQLRMRRCMDTRMLDTLSRDRSGTPEEPINHHDTPGILTAAVPVGLFFDPVRMDPNEIGRLGAEIVALTHGDPLSFLSGAVIAYAVAGIVQDPDTALKDQFLQASDAVAAQFGREYSQAMQLRDMIHRAAAMAESNQPHRTVLEMMHCDSCASVLAGAVYAALRSPEDFDTAMIIAVNHSGRSAAVAALTGAFLGAMQGDDALPDFYLECLEPVSVLRELANDLCQGCPMGGRRAMFDDTWDQKYVQGQRVSSHGWYTDV